MEPKRQRELALGLIAVIVLLVAVYRVRSMTAAGETTAPVSGAQSAAAPPATAGRTSGTAAPTQGRTRTTSGALEDVDLRSLTEPRAQPDTVVRNPFRFRPKPPPPAPPIVRAQPAGPVMPAGPPPPPPITLKFIGRMDRQNTAPVAILSDGRGVYYGREGETLDGRYRIVRIGIESVELAYLDGRGRQTIRLTGQ